MKEITYINRNKKRWEHFEKTTQNAGKVTPDELADQYIQLTDDLSYARTFYHGSRTESYLNGLTMKMHQVIYRSKKESSNRFVLFFVEELPLLFYHSRKEFLVSLLLFMVAMVVGFVSAQQDEGFVRLILGDTYVNMTLDNIEKGDPMGVYGLQDEFSMFYHITSNNIRVAFITFLLGVLTPLGTGFIIFRNGIMVGAFQTFFFQKQLLGVSSMTILIHGSLELSAIVLAGGAGLVLGKSILFPGTYPRSFSFKTGAAKGTKIMLGIVPAIVVAGFLESFITRHYNQIPLIIILSIIILSFAFIVWYYFIFPVGVKKRQEGNTNKQ